MLTQAHCLDSQDWSQPCLMLDFDLLPMWDFLHLLLFEIIYNTRSTFAENSSSIHISWACISSPETSYY